MALAARTYKPGLWPAFNLPPRTQKELFRRFGSSLTLLNRNYSADDLRDMFGISEKRFLARLSDSTVSRHAVREPQTGSIKLDLDGVARLLQLEGIVEWQK